MGARLDASTGSMGPPCRKETASLITGCARDAASGPSRAAESSDISRQICAERHPAIRLPWVLLPLAGSSDVAHRASALCRLRQDPM